MEPEAGTELKFEVEEVVDDDSERELVGDDELLLSIAGVLWFLNLRKIFITLQIIVFSFD